MKTTGFTGRIGPRNLARGAFLDYQFVIFRREGVYFQGVYFDWSERCA
jgi:hypothetical protein